VGHRLQRIPNLDDKEPACRGNTNDLLPFGILTGLRRWSASL